MSVSKLAHSFLDSPTNEHWFDRTDWDCESLVSFLHREYVPGYFEADKIKKGFSQQNISPFRKLKFVFVGKSGVGKSSTVNSFMNAVDGKIMDGASTGRGNGTCKTRKKDGNHFLAGGRLQLIDTPGFNTWDEDSLIKVKEYTEDEKDVFVVLVVVIPKDIPLKDDEESANLTHVMSEILQLSFPKILILSKNDISVPPEQERKLYDALSPFDEKDTFRITNLMGEMNDKIDSRKRQEILSQLIKMLIRGEKEFRNYYQAPSSLEEAQDRLRRNALPIIVLILSAFLLVILFMMVFFL